MSLAEVLPHVSGSLNTLVAIELCLGYAAIRRGDRVRHPRWMVAAVVTGVVFTACYLLQTYVQGHRRFPGEDWVRSLFVFVLLSHTTLAVVVVPLIIATLTLAARGRLEAHRRLARITFPIWFYVAVTGVVVYAMNNWVRPH